MTLDNLVGQQEVKRFLLESLQADRIGHAYLFSGPDGIGKKTFAEYFSYYLTCQNSQVDPCGSCKCCALNKAETNPDIIRIQRQEKKATIGVSDVRFVQEEVMTAPTQSRRKIFIFENAEKMTIQAQNALLKILEEPPSNVIMILLSSNNNQIIDTIKSRIVKIEFKRYTDDEIKWVFKEKYPEKEIDEDILCEYADGIIGRALSMVTIEEYKKACNEIIDGLELLYSKKGKAICEFESKFAANAENKEIYFFILISIMRDIMILGRYGRRVPIQNAQYADRLAHICEKIDYHKAKGCVEIINKAWQMLSKNVNYKLATDMLVIRLQEEIYGKGSRCSI